jgi:FkbM family methyltransferase
MKLAKLVGRREFRCGLRLGVAAAIEHENYLRSVRFATLIDVGANKGQFSLAARAYWPDCEILAFEPLSEAAGKYQCVFQNDRKVRLIRAALGAQKGQSEIHLSRKRDSSSLLTIGELQSRIFPGTDEVGTELINVVTLDSVFFSVSSARPVLLKIDVQGFELEVLKGATDALKSVDAIYAEVSYVSLYKRQPLASEVIAWLSARNFILAGIYNTIFDKGGVAVQSDMHFRRT